MEMILAIAIGVLGGSGVWLVLRPRTFQVLMGLILLSYATNLFIFGMGRLSQQQAPILDASVAAGAVVVALAHQSLRSPRRTVTPAMPDLDGDGLVAPARTD